MSTYPSTRSSVSDLHLDPSLSIREKALVKRHITKQHSSNFKAGYVPVHEPSLHKSGLRGRKTYLFWLLVGVLFVLALCNLFLTFTILGVLRLGQGLESMEVVPEHNLLKFYGNTDLDKVYKRDGAIHGFVDDPMEVEGDDSSVILQVSSGKEPYIAITANSINISNVEGFDVKDTETKATLFSTHYPNFELPRGVKKLDIRQARVARITSPFNSSLHLRSYTFAQLKGSEGAHMEGKEIVWSADQDIYLKTVNGSLVLNAEDGVFLDVNTIPLAGFGTEMPTTGQYKICVCMPQGKLFRVPVHISKDKTKNNTVLCHSIELHPNVNPCM